MTRRRFARVTAVTVLAVLSSCHALQLAQLPTPVTSGEKMIAQAKRYLALGNQVKEQLGPTNTADLQAELAEDFEFVAPIVGPLNKQALIAATSGLDLATATPDFNARYHDFRNDPDDPMRVWFQMRIQATQTGELKFGGQTVPPRDPPRTSESPPEAASIRFDFNGKVREITTGYPLDRRVGNTGGMGGIFGVLEGLGSPLPEILVRSTGEVLEILQGSGPDPDMMQPPVLTDDDVLPEARLLELTKQLLESDFSRRDGGAQLSSDFVFCPPFGDLLGKAAFVESFVDLEAAMPDLKWNYRDVRVCDFDRNRVWFTSSPTGTHTAPLRIGDTTHAPTNKVWESCPECGSAQFDKHGKCISVTGGYPMDRRMGNSEGLCGVNGACVALGLPTPYPVWKTRLLLQNYQRLVAGAFAGSLVLDAISIVAAVAAFYWFKSQGQESPLDLPFKLPGQ